MLCCGNAAVLRIHNLYIRYYQKEPSNLQLPKRVSLETGEATTKRLQHLLTFYKSATKKYETYFPSSILISRIALIYLNGS